MGVVPPEPGFLEAIVALCKAHGAVSIFDEVMTGSRVARGGMQERAGLSPDLTCLGKIIGGGLPLAAYGGKRAIMEKVAPLGPVYQAGTLSGNPVAVSAALATFARLDAALYAHLEALGARLEAGLAQAIARHDLAACVQRVGSMITLFFTRGPGPLVGRREGGRHGALRRVARGDARARALLAAVAVRGGVLRRRAHREATSTPRCRRPTR